VRDVRDRLIARLTGRQPPGVPRRDEPFVLAARDLAPADTATLDPAGVLALVTAEGGPTSHTAILSRALGLPAVVGAPGVLDIAEGTVVLVDGSSGQVVTDPSDDEIAAVREERARESVFDGTGATADGHRVALLANVGDPRDIDAAVEANAEGVGLFRTEFCFLERTEPPTVEEQVTAYRRVLTAFAGKKVVVRTLDAGADKPLPFLAATDEPNPALGVRGYRTTTRSPEIVDDQLAALAQAAQAEEADVWVMAPMIATPQEAEEFVARARSHDLPMAGVMVEVPSAAVCADDVLAHAQFASIGTNDLAQYALAADRTLGEVAVLNDPWQPALLRLIRMTCSAAGERDRPVGVCGEAAADPALACVLVGMGITSLSMTPRAIAAVAAALNRVSREDCARLAQIALRARGPEEARRAVRAELEAR
jgi:phosphotransferase system enzyme I (PtsI)